MNDAASDIDVLERVDHVPSFPTQSLRRETAPLSSLERSVVHLSCQDGLASIPDLKGWRAAIARRFFSRPSNVLANGKLEELRRFSILTRINGKENGDTLARFLDAGYSRRQAQMVGQLLTQWNAQHAQARSGMMIWLALVLLAVTVFVLIQNSVGEILVSAITASIAMAIMASFAAPRNATPH